MKINFVFIFFIFLLSIIPQYSQNILEDDEPFYSNEKYLSLRESLKVKYQLAKYFKVSHIDTNEITEQIVKRTYDSNGKMLKFFSCETFPSSCDSNYSEHLIFRDSHKTIRKILYNGMLEAEYIDNDSTKVYTSYIYQNGKKYLNYESYFDSLGNNTKSIYRDEYGNYSENIFEHKYDFTDEEPKIIETKLVHLNIIKIFTYDSSGREISCIDIRNDIDTSKEFHFYDGVNYTDSVVYYSRNGKADKYVSRYFIEAQREEFIRYDDNDSVYLFHFWYYDDNNSIILDSIMHTNRYIISTHNIFSESNELVESRFFNNRVLKYTESYYYYKNGLPKEYVQQTANKIIVERINYEYDFY